MRLPQDVILEVILRIYIEGYLSICICSLISLRAFAHHEHSLTPGDTFAMIYCIFSMTILIILPLSTFVIIYIYKDHLDDDEKLGRYAMLFTDLNRDRSSQIAYHAIFFMKRFLLSLILVFLKKEGNLQLILIVYLSIAQIIYMVKSEPFIDGSNNKNDVMNELVLIQVCVI